MKREVIVVIETHFENIDEDLMPIWHMNDAAHFHSVEMSIYMNCVALSLLGS